MYKRKRRRINHLITYLRPNYDIFLFSLSLSPCLAFYIVFYVILNLLFVGTISLIVNRGTFCLVIYWFTVIIFS